MAVPQQEDTKRGVSLQLAPLGAVWSWAAGELPLCGVRKSQGEEEGAKAAHGDPQHNSYMLLRPPQAQSTMQCIFETTVLLLCENLARKWESWGVGPDLEGGNKP